MAKEYLIGDILKRIKRPIELDDNADYKLVTIRAKHKGVVLRENKRGNEIKSNMFLVKTGDFILSGIDARHGAFGIISDDLNDAIVTNDFWYFEIDENIISKELFLELTSTTWFDEICNKGSDGTTNRVRLQKDKFFNQIVLLPEKDEQNEILEKIKAFKKNIELLNNENEIQNNLLSQLRQSILQEAIQGKLTESWRKENPNTESAEKLLQRIKTEKEKTAKKGKKSLLPEITENEIPFKLPENWVWCKIENIADTYTGDSINKEVKLAKYTKKQEGLNYIGTKDVDFEMKGITYNTGVIIPTKELNNPFKVAPKNSVLVCIEGGSSGKKIGLTEKDVCFGNKLLATVPFIDDISKYLFYLYNSTYFQKMFVEQSKGLRGGVSVNSFKSIFVPLPPLEELKEIVEQVEKLLGKCTSLQTEIENLNTHSKTLLKALFAETFATETA